MIKFLDFTKLYKGIRKEILKEIDRVLLAGAKIGAGAMIRAGVIIGENAIVGMGSVVLNDVSDGVKVAGNPAKEI